MNKEYILITGVAGLLGSRMADWIIENKSDQYTVVGIDNLFGGAIMSTSRERNTNTSLANMSIWGERKAGTVQRELNLKYSEKGWYGPPAY